VDFRFILSNRFGADNTKSRPNMRKERSGFYGSDSTILSDHKHQRYAMHLRFYWRVIHEYDVLVAVSLGEATSYIRDFRIHPVRPWELSARPVDHQLALAADRAVMDADWARWVGVESTEDAAPYLKGSGFEWNFCDLVGSTKVGLGFKQIKVQRRGMTIFATSTVVPSVPTITSSSTILSLV
jgi:hypothetical protein